MNTRAVCRSAMLLGAFVVALLPRAAHADSLARQLVKVTPEVVKYLQEQRYHNVGVLKFRAQKGNGNGKLQNSIGTLNSTMADRVENALLLGLDAKARPPLGIIDDASAVAEKLGNPSYLTPEGRRKLFEHDQYPLRWGSHRVAPDAFVTGLVILPDDTDVMKVVLCVVDRHDKLKAFKSFEADMTSNLMAEASRDFLILRGIGGTKLAKENLTLPTKLTLEDTRKQQAAKEPVLANKDAPVDLEVYYGDRKIPYRLGADKTATIPEPRQGESVRFELVKKDNSPLRYGVVLKLNGENTLFKQRKDPPQCRKWLLDPKHPRTVVRGYQLDDDQRENFRIASPEESREKEIQYGRNVGQISLAVFVEDKVLPSDLPDDGPGNDLPPGATPRTVEAVNQGKSNVDPKAPKPEDLALAQFDLKDSAGGKPETRGVIVGGALGANKITTEPFTTGRMVMSATVTYYKR